MTSGSLRVHLDVLGWLHVLWGAFGLLTGASLGILALGTTAAFFELGGHTSLAPTVGVLVTCGAALFLAGAAMVFTGRALLAGVSRARLATLLLSVLNLFLVPFGTALAIYAFWTLLNDDARRTFGARS